MRRLIPFTTLLLFLSVGSVYAFDPSLADALLDNDPAVRANAYLRAGALSDPDKINLAPFISERLEDPVVGERAALALCRLGDVGVPYLDRHARTSFPGAEYATMGLLAGDGAGHAAVAAILRNGDEAAVIRTLGVIEASTMMPPMVAAEVQRLADDTDLHFAKPARSAIAAVDNAKAAKEGDKKPGSLAAELEKASNGASAAPSDDEMKKLVATLQASGPAGQQALNDALAAGSIDKATYDQIQSLLSASPTEGAVSTAPAETKEKWAPDPSKFKTRQSAADAFSKHK